MVRYTQRMLTADWSQEQTAAIDGNEQRSVAADSLDQRLNQRTVTTDRLALCF